MPLKSATFKKMKLSAANQAIGIGQCYIGLENRWMEFSVGATPKSTSVAVTSAPDCISLQKKNSSRILHDTKTDCARTIHAGGHHQQFAVLDEFVRLGKIPDRPLRLVITPTAEDSTPCVFVGELFRPLPDVADQVHHTKCASTFRMCVYRIGTPHRSVFIRFRHRGCVPLVAPGIDAAIGGLCGILPLPS